MMGHRYYSPELCRFIQPDSIEYLDSKSINGLNLYCFCIKNPIMYADPSGYMPEWLQWTFGGIKYANAANVNSFSNSVSGLNKAQSSINNAWKPLSNIKNLANMPFSSANIARTVGQAAANYNAVSVI